MKKTNRKVIIIVACGILVGLFVIARLTGVLQFYSTPAGSMEPTLPVGSHFMVSNLKKPVRNDVIAFSRIAGDREFVEPGTEIRVVHRLLAFGGETIQIKHGLAYVDGKLADDSTHLKFSYTMPVNRIDKIREILKADETDFGRIQVGEFEATALLSYDEYRQISAISTANRQEFPYFDNTDLYKNDSIKKWTIDNYGPMKIPEEHFFVLGDNRHAAMDSRYIGPVPIKNFKGTLVFKY